MSYGKILGRLIVARRGKPRRGSKSGNCITCRLPVVEGSIHIVLVRSMAKKDEKTGKQPWFTRRFHMSCIQGWLDWQVEQFPEMETKAKAARSIRSRPILSRIEDPVKLASRNKMVKRRSYLINCILAQPNASPRKKEDIESEVRSLGYRIYQIAPGLNFATKKRGQLYVDYLEKGGQPLHTKFDETAKEDPEQRYVHGGRYNNNWSGWEPKVLL